jgi:hypothetical protein
MMLRSCDCAMRGALSPVRIAAFLLATSYLVRLPMDVARSL